MVHSSGGSRIFPRGGREPSRGGVNTPNFPENCMKSKEFGRPGGACVPHAPPRSANAFTPAIFSTIAWTCTIRVILGCTVLNETIHTCDFSNYCVNLKVKEWVVYPFLRDFLRDFCALYWVGNKFSCFVDIFCTLLFM